MNVVLAKRVIYVTKDIDSSSSIMKQSQADEFCRSDFHKLKGRVSFESGAHLKIQGPPSNETK